jgi:hypothetical protein
MPSQHRHAADRERDEHISRYEEKCREMERFKDSTASQTLRTFESLCRLSKLFAEHLKELSFNQ